MSQRQRMYIFERAYVDYGARLRRFIAALKRTCGGIWDWFWRGFGSKAIEFFLQCCVVAGAVTLAVMYARYESAHGRGFSFAMAAVFAIILFCAGMVLWGWKAPVHFLARLVSGTAATALVAVLAIAAVIAATAVFSVYLAALFVLTALSFLVFVPFRLGQEVWLFYRHIGYRCPHGDCPSKGLPIHICTCGREYSDLLPSFYGLFHHVCRHEDGSQMKLPTMDVLGRNKLARLCAGCRRPLAHSDIGDAAEWPIALVGGPSSGKTVLLVQAIGALRRHFDAVKGLVRLGGREREYDTLRAQLDRGQLLPKTAGGVAEAWGVSVRVAKGTSYPKGLRSLLYLFDNPGEIFGSMQQLGQMHALQNLRGVVLLVDPFSLSQLAGTAKADVAASQTPLLTVAGNLVNAVNQYIKEVRGERSAIPLAVVLTKTDALPVDDHPYLAGLLPSDARSGTDVEERCRQAIRKLGGGPALDALALNFSNMRYFACSALGRVPDRSGKAFQPAGVLEPFLWMLDHAAGAVKHDRARAQTA